MAKRSSLRASDADRERVAERLKQATTEGRILAHELEERLAAALRARTYGDLDEVVADLPGARVATPSRATRTRQLVLARPMLALAVAVAAIVMVVMVAAVVLASLFALSGIWVMIAVFALVHRGRNGSYRRFPPRPPHPPRPPGGGRIGDHGAGGAWRY